MANKIEQTGDLWTLTVMSQFPIPLDAAYWLKFMDVYRILAATISLSSFLVDRIGVSSNYKYEFILVDGREWKQTIDMSNPDIPLVNFTNVQGYYAQFELSPHVDVRLWAINLIKQYGVTKISGTAIAP